MARCGGAGGAVRARPDRQKDNQPPGGEERLGLVVPMRDGVRLAADLFLPR